MTETSKTPWHLWVVGIIMLLWSAGGAFDYAMTQTRNADYIGQFTPEQLEYFYSFPSWVVATWAIGVWGGVLGALLLLIRSRWAVPVFWLSLLATLATAVYTFVLADVSMAEITGSFAIIFSALILVVSALLVWYAQRMRARGVLR